MTDFERPVHVVITGDQVTYTPVTDEEIAAQEERERLFIAQEKDRLAARAADLEAVRGEMEKNPAYAALVRILGINVSP